MAIRFRKYKSPRTGEVTAIKLTPNNVAEVVAYINKNGGTAVDESVLIKSPDLRDGEYLAVKVAVSQLNLHSATGRLYRGVRKAFRGDFIVRELVDSSRDNPKPHYQFSRVRDAGVNDFVAV